MFNPWRDMREAASPKFRLPTTTPLSTNTEGGGAYSGCIKRPEEPGGASWPRKAASQASFLQKAHGPGAKSAHERP